MDCEDKEMFLFAQNYGGIKSAAINLILNTVCRKGSPFALCSLFFILKSALTIFAKTISIGKEY
jgi:hypothetical protein